MLTDIAFDVVERLAADTPTRAGVACACAGRGNLLNVPCQLAKRICDWLYQVRVRSLTEKARLTWFSTLQDRAIDQSQHCEESEVDSELHGDGCRLVASECGSRQMLGEL